MNGILSLYLRNSILEYQSESIQLDSELYWYIAPMQAMIICVYNGGNMYLYNSELYWKYIGYKHLYLIRI